MRIEKFEEPEIWKEARLLCKLIYEYTEREPFNSDYRFHDQIRASSGSIMNNIAEGFERGGNKEFIHFLSIAKGSCAETRSQSYRAFDFHHIEQEILDQLLESSTILTKKITSLIAYLKKSDFKGAKFA